MKKIIIFAMFFLLFLSTFSYAQICEVSNVKQVLRKILHLYFTEPGSVPLTKDEVKDLLVFYLSISAQNLTADCSVLGANSNKPIFDVMDIGDALPEKIPSCTDGTKYGECSKFRPAYCYAGALYQKCDLCGCPANSVCGKSKRCEPLSQNITCFSDIDCGQNTFIGDYYCTNNYISKNYINYTCINPGTTSSKCVATNSTVFLTYCNPNLNQACVNGQSTCKTTINDSAPTVSISVAPTTAAQGQFFNVTVTGTDDIGLAAIWWWAINTTDAELNKAHWFSCNGAKFCTYSWLVSTNAVGSITLGANSRDTAYPVIGQPHQASEGQGIAYATLTITGAVQNLTGLPDLVVINLGTYTGTTSTDILISATILNNGTGPAQNTCDGLYVETLNARGFCGGPVLMPGQTKSISSAFALPVPGTFKVRADTDYGYWVNESNEFNNVVWSTITVTSPYSAEYLKANTDLTVTDISVQLPTSSSSADVKVTTKNLGSLATGQYWVLTKVTHIDTGKITNVLRLAPVVQPGSTYTTSHGIVGIAEYGTYKVEAFVDNSNYIPESDENNNFMSVTVIYGNVTQANVTNATANCFVKVNGTVIKSAYATDRIDCYNKTSFGSLNCQVYTPYFKDGVNFLEQYFGTTDRVNNEYCSCLNGICVQGITNQTTLPDLIVSDITFTPASPTTADYTTVSFTIKNIGTAPASNFSLKVDYVGGQSFLFGTGYLPAGATTSPGSLGNYWPAGTNTFIATVDVNNNVVELDENNNILTKSITITSTTNQTKSITIISPNGGETWYYNNFYPIQYKFSGVKLIGFQLFNGSNIIHYFSPLDAGAAFNYYVDPAREWMLGTGNNYKIKIYDFDNPAVYDESDAPFSIAWNTTSQTTTLNGQCKTVDFENPPHLSFHLTWNPDLGAQDSYNYNLDETARQWLKSQGINITGTPNGIVWGTGISGPVGNTGVVVGFASPNFLEQDSGLSDNEQLTVRFLNALPKSVQVDLTTQPSDVSIINNVPSTVVIDALDSVGNVVATTTKTFTGVTNGVYTPTKINVTASASNIAKINLRTTQHPYGGVYIEDINSCT